jgi:pyruvate dehydrogenase E1 component alpha subunit
MPFKTIENFTIGRLEILSETGELDKSLEPALSDDDLIKLHRAMTLSRLADLRVVNLQRQGRLGTLPVSFGQEASFCPPMLAIKETDWFVGSYRELGARLMRGESLMNTLLLFNGYEEGSFNENNSRTLPLSIVLASQIPQAVGLAYGSRLKGEKDTVALVMFGEGASSEGDFHEALNFAGVLNAPVIFFCQNNQYAISTPLELQSKSKTIAQKAIAYGIPGIQVDGNDALAVYQATVDAVARARKGEGPTLIESVTYRLRMHTTADDPTRYRPDEEVKLWEKKGPLIRFKIYLKEKGLWDDEKQEEMEKEIKAEIDNTVKEFEARTGFKDDAPFDYLFGTKVDIIEKQRAEFLKDKKLDMEG